MTIPTLKVEMAFGSGFSTPEGSRTWTDVTSYVAGELGGGVSSYGRSDEQSQPSPNTWSRTFENSDGRFTPGYASSPYYPNVVKGVPVREGMRYADFGSGNFLSASQAAFESGVGDWTAGGTVPPTLSSSTTHVDQGSKSMLITWGTGGALPLAAVTIDDRVVVGGLVLGRTYTAQARVWVPSGSPNPQLVVASVVAGTGTGTKNAFATISVTFTATASAHALQVWPTSAPTSGQQCWVDSVMVDEGSAVGTFTTSAPPTDVRFTGYVNEWPVEWPTGGDNYSTVTVTATSRRARLGQSAPLPSAIRAANLARVPQAYWPMTEDIGSADAPNFDNIDIAGQFIFRDITNPVLNGQLESQYLAAFLPRDGAVYLVVHDGTPGPTDETSLVYFPEHSTTADDRYVGGSDRMKIGNDVAGVRAASFGCVARVTPRPSASASVDVNLMQIFSPDGSQTVWFFLYSDPSASGSRYVGVDAQLTNPLTGAVVDAPGWVIEPGINSAAIYDSVTDGQIHHFHVNVYSDSTSPFADAYLWVDGVNVAHVFLDGSNVFTQSFTQIEVGSRVMLADAWIGHAYVADRYYDPTADITPLAAAATAASETVSARVTRLATYLGVPAAEIDTSTSIAAELGPQAELGQSASSVLDAVATSTGGVLYDGRDGHLKMTARNDRYTSSSLVTLSTSGDEIEADLKIQYDDRYLVNTVEVTRAGSDQSAPLTFTDAASIAAYGVYTLQTTMVSSSDDEAEAYGRDVLYRYAQPKVRVSQVTVDVCDLSISQRAAVLALDIGSKLTLSGLPLQAGASSMVVFVEGYSESYATTGKHLITFNTTPVAGYPSMAVVGTATVGSSTLVVY